MSVLLATLLPAVSSARSQARAIVCLNNVRQIGAAVLMYGNDFQEMPPNVSSPAPGRWWCDEARVMQYLKGPAERDSVWACPEDEGSARSYAMNIWASSAVDGYITQASPQRGRRWTLGDRHASSIILVAEAWSTLTTSDGQWAAEPFIGYAGLTPGQRFGVAGLRVDAKRWGFVSSELPYYRHRRGRTTSNIADTVGRVSVAYCDGHADLRSNYDLASRETGLSSLDTLWSAWDLQNNR